MTTEDKVRVVIRDHLGVDDEAVTPDANLLDDLNADSLDIVELTMSLEEEFGINIDDDDVEKAFVTVGSVTELITAKLGKEANDD